MVFLLVCTCLCILLPIMIELLRKGLSMDRNYSRKFLLFYERSFNRISFLIFVIVGVSFIWFIISLLSRINLANGNDSGKNILLTLRSTLTMNDVGITATRNLRTLTFVRGLLFNKLLL